MTLEFTPAAISDLQSIRAYTLEQWGAEQEQIYLDSPWSKFEEILADPGRSRVRNDLFPGCQIAAQGRHVILFRMKGGHASNRADSPQLNGFSPPYSRTALKFKEP